MNAGLMPPISGIVLIMTLILAIAFIAMDYKDIGAWPEAMINDQRSTIND